MLWNDVSALRHIERCMRRNRRKGAGMRGLRRFMRLHLALLEEGR